MHNTKKINNEKINVLPNNWKMMRIKSLFTERNEKSINNDENDLLAVSEYYGVAPKKEKVKTHEALTRADTLDGYKVCKKNDLAINIMLAWKGALGISNYDGIISPSYSVFSPDINICPKYFHYLFRTDYYKGIFKIHSTGIIDSRLRLYPEKFLSLYAIVPPLFEQQKIALFLDEKTKEIDNAIENTEETIELYKKYKQALITEAVTKGLNPNVNMEDAPINGIKKMPKAWSTVSFFQLNSIRGRLGWKGLKADEYVDKGYPFLSAFNIIDDKLSWDKLNYITKERFDESPEIKLKIHDLLLVKDGNGIGKCAFIDSLPQGEATVNSSLAVITPSKYVYYKYEYYFFLSSIFQNVIWLLKNGMGVPHLTQESMKDIKMPLPSYEEQVKIASYLDKKSNEIEKIILGKKKQLLNFDNYKKSLIYEYVTGKKGG